MKTIARFIGKATALSFLVSVSIFAQKPEWLIAEENTVNIGMLFPSTPEQMVRQTEQSMQEAKQIVQEIIAIADHERTFANTVKKLDELLALSSLSLASGAIHVLEMVSPEESIRTAAHQSTMRLGEFFIDEVANNYNLYLALNNYFEKNACNEDLSPKQKYCLEEMIMNFKRKGFDLPEEKREQAKQLQKDLAVLTLEFSANIASCQSKIELQKEDIIGLPEDFIASLEQTESGYQVVVNAPNNLQIMENCEVTKTRERMYKAYMNRAYPVNDAILKEIIAKRDRLARLKGFESHAAYDVEQQMAQTPEKARNFLNELIERIKPKVNEEFHTLTKTPHPSVQLDEKGRLYPWDRSFIENQYKKKHLQVDEQEIAEYFPLDTTIKNVLSIYETFFSLQLSLKKTTNLWHEEVMVVEVSSKDEGQLLGCILLDLFPRPFKYGHACDINIIPATYQNGSPNVALSLVITNFPRPLEGKPALLQRSNVKTLLHELGHALHDMLGRTPFASRSGTNVKMDFVEMPSQMLEEWMTDKAILKMVSSHYLTGEPMPDALAGIIVSLKNSFSGLSAQQQLYFSRLSLDLFGPGEEKDPYEIAKNLGETIRTHIVFCPDDHMYASFGHLSGYGAKYYGYMWSKVFALDLFSLIKEQGLLDAKIGGRYAKEVIGEGGSVDPNILLEGFLGRPPSNEAFLRDLGLVGSID